MFDDIVNSKKEQMEDEIVHIPIPCCYCGSANVEIVDVKFDDGSEVKAKLCFSCQRAEVLWIVK